MLPDSQCGFRRGKVCIDKIFFCARQIIEKADNMKIFKIPFRISLYGIP